MQTKQEKRAKAIKSFESNVDFYTNAGMKEILAAMLNLEVSSVTPKILKNADENEIRNYQRAKIKAAELNLSNTRENYDNPDQYRQRQKAKKHRHTSSGRKARNSYQSV